MTKPVLALVVFVVALTAATPALAQDPLSGARALYASARYDEALDLLDRLRLDASVASTASLAIDRYRALCLLALGRENEADSAFAGVVAADPMYLPDAREVSPSVRAFFQEVRRRMLPGIARAGYAQAKAAYDRREYDAATVRFQQVLTLLADEDMAPGLDDLRELAAGFEELSRARAQPAAATGAPNGEPVPARSPVAPGPQSPAAPAPPPPDPASDAPEVYGPESPGITPPVTLEQELPAPPPEVRQVGRSRGLLEILIDQQGRVAAVVLRKSIHLAYDRQLIEAATHWRYEPARIDGKAVKYRKVIEVTVR